MKQQILGDLSDSGTNDDKRLITEIKQQISDGVNTNEIETSTPGADNIINDALSCPKDESCTIDGKIIKGDTTSQYSSEYYSLKEGESSCTDVLAIPFKVHD